MKYKIKKLNKKSQRSNVKGQMYNDLQNGQSILEVIVAMAIFGLISAAMISMVTGSFVGLTQGGEQTQAEALAQEGVEAVKAIYDEAWNQLTYATSSISISGGKWVLDGEGTTETIGQFTRTISFADVCRDVSDNITACPGSYTDVQSKQVTVTVTWDTRDNVSNTVQRITYITNWDSREWTQTNWVGGTGQSTWSDTTKYDTGTNVDHSTVGQLQLAEATDGTWSLSGGTEVTHTSDTDFNSGTFSNAIVSGTGNAAKIILTQSTSWTEHIDSASTTASELKSIYMITASDGWAVGKDGKILRYNGTSWIEHTDTGGEDWRGVYAFDANNAWVVGKDGNIRYFNGTSWSMQSSPTSEDLEDVSGFSANNVFTVGKKGVIVEYDGNSWSATSSPINQDLKGVDMRTPTDGWIVGKNGKIAHYDGNNWTEHADSGSPTTEELRGVSAAASNNAWAVGKKDGNNGVIIGYDGSNWTATTSPLTADIAAVYIRTTTDGWAVGNGGSIAHYDGSNWTSTTSPISNDLKSVYAVAEDDVWAVGKNGKIIHYGNSYVNSGTFTSPVIDGGANADWNTASWTEILPSGSDVTIATRSGDTATPDGSWSGWSAELTDPLGSTIASADARYLQYRVTFTRGDSTSQTPELDDITIIYNAPTTSHLNDLAIISSSDIWAVGKNGTIIHYNGTSWSTVSSPTTKELRGISAVSSNDVWAAGNRDGANGTIIHYNGSSWSSVTAPVGKNFNAIDMRTSNDGWIVGKNGYILHYNGTAWSDDSGGGTDTGNEEWRAVIAIAADDVWVGGRGGNVAHYDGDSWVKSVVPSADDIEGMYAVSASDVWAVGKNGLIWRYNGSSWSLHTDTNDDTLYGVSLVNASDGWAVGKNGDIRRWLGSSWVNFTSPTTQELRDVEMISWTSGWAVGGNGTILRFSRDALYETSGTATSSAFNMSNASPVQAIEWDEIIHSCSPACDITIDISTAPDSGGSPGTWTSWQNATAPNGVLLPISLNGNQWVRYRANFTGDGNDTPVLTEVRVNYK